MRIKKHVASKDFDEQFLYACIPSILLGLTLLSVLWYFLPDILDKCGIWSKCIDIGVSKMPVIGTPLLWTLGAKDL